LETKKIVGFSDSEVNEGIRYSRSIHGFEKDIFDTINDTALSSNG